MTVSANAWVENTKSTCICPVVQVKPCTTPGGMRSVMPGPMATTSSPSGEEGQAFLDGMRVQQHALAGLQPLLSDEDAARPNA